MAFRLKTVLGATSMYGYTGPNQFQQLFLDKENQKQLLNNVLGNPGEKFKYHFEPLSLDKDFINYFGKINIPKINRLLDKSVIEFDYCGWDFALVYLDHQCFTFKTKTANASKNNLYNVFNKYNFNYSGKDRVLDTFIKENDIRINTVCERCILLCEIRPVLGEDYLCVLNQMKLQIEQTNEEFKKKEMKFEQNNIYVLIIGNFISSKTTNAELISIFAKSNIKVVFLKKTTIEF